ncbi:YbaK/EbsC family protein [Leuconostoc sp. JNUCC 76]
MSVENVRQFFKKYHLENRIVEHENIGDTVEHAAELLKCEIKQIAKSMTFIVEENPVLIVLAGDKKVDNKKFKSTYNSRPKMIPFDQVADRIGHIPGAVTPFAIKSDVKVYLDVSLKRFETVFAAGGSTNSTIELSIDELENYAHPLDWVDVGKDQ